MATTSDSHSGPDDRVVVDHSAAGRANMALARSVPAQAPSDLRDHVATGLAVGERAVDAVDRGDHRVELATRDGSEHQDEPDERHAGGHRVLQQLEPDVVGREPLRGDPRAHHRDQQEAAAERLGRELARQAVRHRRSRGQQHGLGAAAR